MGATTYDGTTLTEYSGDTFPYFSGGARWGSLVIPVSFADIVINKGTMIPSSADILKLFAIPTGSVILGGDLDVQTAVTDSGTVTGAFNDGTTTFLSATDLKTKAKTAFTMTAIKCCAASTFLVLTLGGNAATATVGIFVVTLHVIIPDLKTIQDITWH